MSSQSIQLVTPTLPKFKTKAPVPRRVVRWNDTASALQYLISLYDITHHSEEVTTKEASEAGVDEVTGISYARKPQVSSVYLPRGFLLFNDTGSFYYKNDKQSINLGRLLEDGTFQENPENSDILVSIQNGNYAFLKRENSELDTSL